jgi:hypothetical protein
VGTSFRNDIPKPHSQNPNSELRTWNTPIRDPWNPIIKHCLNAIDYHIDLFVQTHDPWHFCQAQKLRDYLKDLKNWITEEEGKSNESH